MDDLVHYQTMSLDVGFNCFTPPGIYLTKDEADLREKVRVRIERYEQTGATKFPMFERSTGRFIGICGGDWFDLKRAQPPAPGARPESLELELGYRLLLEYWGKGYATEAAIAMLAHLHQALGRRTIYAFALHQNAPSLKVLERIGFEYEREFVWAELKHRLYHHRLDRQGK